MLFHYQNLASSLEDCIAESGETLETERRDWFAETQVTGVAVSNYEYNSLGISTHKAISDGSPESL